MMVPHTGCWPLLLCRCVIASNRWSLLESARLEPLLQTNPPNMNEAREGRPDQIDGVQGMLSFFFPNTPLAINSPGFLYGRSPNTPRSHSLDRLQMWHLVDSHQVL